jgi:MFS family permease
MKRILWYLTFATLFSSLSVELFVPFYAVFVQKIGGGLILAGATWAIYRLASSGMMLIAGRVADRNDPRNLLISGFGLRVVGTAGYFLVSTPVHLLAIQALQGIAHALIVPSYRKLYSENLDKRRAGSEWSYPQAGKEFSMAVAVLAGGAVLDALGFFPLFLMMLIAHGVSFIMAVAAKKSVEADSQPCVS